MIQELLLVRHAQSEHHVRDLTGGWTDTPLTPLGHAQAARLAARIAALPGRPPELIIASDLARSAQTAAAIRTRTGLPLQFDADLREINNGVAAGLRRAEAERLRRPRSGPHEHWQAWDGAETWAAMSARVAACIARLDAQPGAQRVVVVAHALSGDVIVRWWLRLAVGGKSDVHFTLDPASLSVLRINEYAERAVVALNDTAHLAVAETPPGAA